MTGQNGSGKDVNVRIANLGDFISRGGGIQKVQVETLDTKQMLEVSIFLNQGQWHFNIGDQVTMFIKQGNEYRGVKPWITGLDKITPIETKEMKEEEKEMSKEDWEAKEIRSHRRACCAIAASLMTEEERKHFAGRDFSGIDTDRVGMVMLVADKLLQYVNTGENVEIKPAYEDTV